jgi:hypothetical protein
MHLQNAAPVKLRVRGPRTFEDIPPGELLAAAGHVFQVDCVTWGSDEHLHAILELFDLKRLTTQVGTRMLEILERSNGTSTAATTEATEINHQPSVED